MGSLQILSRGAACGNAPLHHSFTMRLRIAIGLVAAERSPKAYTMNAHPDEQWEFEREFAWFMRLMIIFGLMHLVIFVILLAVPK